MRVHDTLVAELGRAVPYGNYDMTANTAWVGLGADGDTAALAMAMIRRW